MNRGRTILATWTAAAIGVGICIAAHAESDWRGSTGVDFSSGDYGSEVDTEILYVPLSLRYRSFPWTAKITVPYIRIEGPVGVVGGAGGGGGVIIGDGGGTRTESGIGDIFGSIKYSVDPVTEGAPYIDLTSKVKFPAADEDKDLGTGEFDYTVEADFAWKTGRVFPFVAVGYQFLGDPDGFDLNDRFKVSLGIDMKVVVDVNLGALYDWKEASTDESDDPNEAVAYVNWKASDRVSVNAYVYTGLSDGSPDWGAGLQISLRR